MNEAQLWLWGLSRRINFNLGTAPQVGMDAEEMAADRAHAAEMARLDREEAREQARIDRESMDAREDADRLRKQREEQARIHELEMAEEEAQDTASSIDDQSVTTDQDNMFSDMFSALMKGKGITQSTEESE